VDGLVIARQFFSRRESEWLAKLPAAQRGTAFFRRWTAREALLKATGHGLTVPLNQLEFPAEWEGSLRVSHSLADGDSPVEWSIWHCSTPAGAVLAVAARGTDWTLVPRNDCNGVR
jgi:4'-phosphopantetheinyl transferase